MNNKPIKNSTLFLTLKKKQFDVTISGEKIIEYRRDSNWIKSRLIDRSYDLIKFTNGYGHDKRYFIVEYLGYKIVSKEEILRYSNGLEVILKPGYFAIKLGELIEKGNL